MVVSLLCLIGIPGSGKTTLATSLDKYFKKNDINVVFVEYDSYISEDCYAQGLWKETRRCLLQKVEGIARDLVKSKQNSVIVLDDNFFYRSMRYGVYKLAKRISLGFVQICLNVPFEFCSSNNTSRSNPLPLDVLLKMHSLIEYPDARQNAWEKYSITFSEPVLPDDFPAIHDLVYKSWSDPCTDIPDKQHPLQRNSSVHYADLALRRIINETVLSAPSDDRSQVIKHLIIRRKHVLDDLKSNNIVLPTSESENDDYVSMYVTFLKPLMLSGNNL